MNRFSQKKSFYFFKTALSLFVLAVCLALAVGFQVFSATQQDLDAYHALMLEANPTLGDKTAKPSYQASQKQHLVRKDIFLYKDAERKHLLLTSADVNLLLNQNEGVTELTEELSDVDCYLQHACYYKDPNTQSIVANATDASLPQQGLYHAKAEKAHFSYKDKTVHAKKVTLVDCEAPGHRLYPKISESQASISINASTADFDGKSLSLSGEVFLRHSLGFMSADKVFVQKVPFQDAKRAAYIEMKGAIKIYHQDLGTLINDQIVNVLLVEKQEKKELQTVEADGHSVLTHTEAQKQLSHTLVCEGKILADHEKGIVLLQSPTNAEGMVPQEKQVFFYDALGEAQADRMTVHYQKTPQGLAATKVNLEGNVYLVDNKMLNENETGPKEPLHYALADLVEYDPATREIILSSYPGNRVLFYDKVNKMQVSSSIIKVFRDQVTGKDAFKGIGDVRFHFLESEFEQLSKRINFNLKV